jgi:hypothetical protein
MIRNDIIEECAQVAEEAASEAQHDYENKQEGEYLWCVDQSNEIADLIRQRKDED